MRSHIRHTNAQSYQEALCALEARVEGRPHESNEAKGTTKLQHALGPLLLSLDAAELALGRLPPSGSVDYDADLRGRLEAAIEHLETVFDILATGVIEDERRGT